VLVVLLDNGRSAVLADEIGRQALACIRCSACLNVCPVYERTGGHAYGSVYPGPIGAILSPQLTGVAANPTLPFASSLCGACYDVCPVKINIPEVLVHLRAKVVDGKRGRIVPTAERLSMQAVEWMFTAPGRLAVGQRLAGWGSRLLAGRRGRISNLPPPLSGWTSARDIPPIPKETFRTWWRQTHPEERDS
jgi:L-lactate dehydrogenase complex protein LldF